VDALVSGKLPYGLTLDTEKHLNLCND
jgi:hypothetical protein